MTIRLGTHASARRTRPRFADKALGWYSPRISFISTCPKCGQARTQHGFTRQVLLEMLSKRRQIDAYCIVCNVCWPIKEYERRAISPQ
jgi:hypothetical protein